MSQPSKIPESESEEKEQDEDSKKLALAKVINRDNSKKLFASILSILSVFIYQITVFYA